MPCPHPGLQVGGCCCFCLKVAALNGHRSKLTLEQLTFVGFVLEHDEPDRAWVPAAQRSNVIEQQLDEIARLRAVAPGWYRLAREIVKDDGDGS